MATLLFGHLLFFDIFATEFYGHRCAIPASRRGNRNSYRKTRIFPIIFTWHSRNRCIGSLMLRLLHMHIFYTSNKTTRYGTI